MKNISDEVLLEKTFLAAKDEQNATLVLLEYLAEVDLRKSYVPLGYSGIFDFVVRGLKYSESQASERVNAMRLIRSLPQVKEHIESGELNLTNAAQIQRFIKIEKKHDPEFEPETLIPECLGQSKRKVEKILMEHASIETKHHFKEKMKETPDDRVEFRFTLDKETVDRLKELVRYGSMEELFTKAANALIREEERKLGKVPTPPAEGIVTPDPEIKIKNPNSRYLPKKLKQAIYQRSQGQCEHTDHNGRCPSKHHLEVDHITPFALGGQTTPENLRHFCHAHNQFSARRAGLPMRFG